MISYIKAISIAYPNIKCSAIGNGKDYDLIEWASDTTVIPTKAELDDFIANYKEVEYPSHYVFDETRGAFLSPVHSEVVFSSQAVAAKNYYLSAFGQISSNIHGYIVAEESVLISSECRIAKEVTENVTFSLYANDNLIHSVTIDAGKKITLEKTLNIKIPVDSMLSCKISGAKVDYPLCRFMLAGA